jgi:hypothetical protein
VVFFFFYFQQGMFSILTVCDVLVCADFVSFFLQQTQLLTVAQQKVEILPRITMVMCKQITQCCKERTAIFLLLLEGKCFTALCKRGVHYGSQRYVCS